MQAILGVSNLEEVSVKKIRNALQELFGVDLLPHKNEINKVILGRYYDLQTKRENDATEKLKRKEMEKLDALLAAKLMREPQNGALLRARKQKKAAKVTDSTKPKRDMTNVGFNKEMVLSNELYNVLGSERMSRPQVVKNLWVYIKDNELQNPKDKRQINCDSKLEALFKKKTVGSFEMNKILTKHIFAADEVGKVKQEVVDESSEED